MRDEYLYAFVMTNRGPSDVRYGSELGRQYWQTRSNCWRPWSARLVPRFNHFAAYVQSLGQPRSPVGGCKWGATSAASLFLRKQIRSTRLADAAHPVSFCLRCAG